MTDEKGFTLIETLAAVIIISVTLAAAVRSAGVAASGSEMVRMRLGAMWTAHNVMEQTKLSGPALPGAASGEEEQGGEIFLWRKNVTSASTPGVYSVDVRVYPKRDPSYEAAALTGLTLGEKADESGAE